MEGHFYHRDELEAHLNKFVGLTLGQADSRHVFDRAKKFPKITGIAGDVVEQSILGYDANSSKEPDLNIDGVRTELKTTGLKRAKDNPNNYVAKEPMSITAVSPNQIVHEQFLTSHFWEKLQHLLIIYYLYDSGKKVTAIEYSNFPIVGFDFHEFSEQDQEILKHDWTLVRDFISMLQNSYEDYEAEYPRLSHELRSELLYIDTAPKWPNYPRFRLKKSVVTNIWEERQGKEHEKLLQEVDSFSDFDEACHKVALKFVGKSGEEILSMLNRPQIGARKNSSEAVVVAMFGGNSTKMADVELFDKVGIVSKTIILNKNGKPTEDLKFNVVNFDEFQDREMQYDESTCYDYFNSSTFLFSVFEEPYKDAPLTNCIFRGFKRIVFDDNFLEVELKMTWEEIKDLIINNKLKNEICYDKDGKAIVNKSGTIKSAPNFPKSSTNIIFLRGTATDARFKNTEINGIKMARQNYWVKRKYIIDELNKAKYL